MQNVVEVACSSPPVAMNATKSAVQSTQAPDQDPFGAVLQKASERIDNKNQYEGAKKSSESNQKDDVNKSDSSANNKTDQVKNKSEVEHKENIKTEEQSTDEEKVSQQDEITNSTNLIFGYVTPVTTNTENVETVESTVFEESDQAILTGNTVQTTIVATEQAEDGDKNEAISQMTDMGLEEENASKVESESDAQPETKSNVLFNKTLDQSSGEDSTIAQTNSSDSKDADKKADGVKINLAPNAENHGQEVSTVAKKVEDSASLLNRAAVKSEKALETSSDSAPPDTPDGTADVTPGTVVQTASQISEPARLAEAPKNEVITQVATQVDTMVKTNQSSLRMQLYPEELGHIDLRIVTTKDGISVTMVTEKASTQQVLKSDMDMLKQNIEQAGIQLSNLNINQGQNSNRQQSFEHRQNFTHGSYSGTNSDSSNSFTNEPVKQLVSSVVDFKA